MSPWKRNAAVAAAVVGLAAGALNVVSPTDPARPNDSNHHIQQQVNDLSDADEQNKSRIDEDADDLRNAENARRNGAAEHRPPRLRLP